MLFVSILFDLKKTPKNKQVACLENSSDFKWIRT